MNAAAEPGVGGSSPTFEGGAAAGLDPALDQAIEAGRHLAGLISATIALAKAEAREHLGRLITLVLLLALGGLIGAGAALVLAVSLLAALVAWLDSVALGLLLGAVTLGVAAAILFWVALRGFRRFQGFPASREELRRTLALVGRPL